MPIKDICRAGGFSQLTLYKWRSRFGDLEASDAAKFRHLKSDVLDGLRRLIARCCFVSINEFKPIEIETISQS